MKKILNIIIAMICTAGLFTSCETERDSPMLGSNAIAKPVITSTIPATAVITADNLDSKFTTVKYTPAVYSAAVPITNQVQISLSNTFPESQTTSVGAAASEDSIVITNKVLNSAIVAVGGVTLESNTAWLRIKSAVSATTGSPEIGLVSYSDPVQVTITPYEPQPAWIYMPGAHQGWNPATAPALCSLTDNGIYIGYVKFDAAGVEFKFTGQRDWDPLNWGSSDGATLVEKGANILSPGAGYYKITVDLNNLTLVMEAYSWGIIGDATPGGWDADTDMDWNYENQQWESTIPLTVGEIKFRLNDGWDNNYGGSGGDAVPGGNNITITDAGTYFITLDIVNLKYTLTKL
ncbi:MAG: SusF/SusE family outer membrane protein [Paludibacter sp.]|jgi:hypothetical protein|nr:SusF/SusE family outer membrane protein [Paludibacter sp.]